MTYDAVILGSGPAGFEAARRIARNGRRTALVTASPPGGRATVGSLLPSKGWLHHAEHLSTWHAVVSKSKLARDLRRTTSALIGHLGKLLPARYAAHKATFYFKATPDGAVVLLPLEDDAEGRRRVHDASCARVEEVGRDDTRDRV